MGSMFPREAAASSTFPPSAKLAESQVWEEIFTLSVGEVQIRGLVLAEATAEINVV